MIKCCDAEVCEVFCEDLFLFTEIEYSRDRLFLRTILNNNFRLETGFVVTELHFKRIKTIINNDFELITALVVMEVHLQQSQTILNSDFRLGTGLITKLHLTQSETIVNNNF